MKPKKSSDKAKDVRYHMERFVQTIDSLRMTVGLAMKALGKEAQSAHERVDHFIAKYGETKEVEGKRMFRVRSHDHCDEFGKLRRELNLVHAGVHVVPRSFFVALVSQYDAYLGNLIRALFSLRPELLRSSDKQLTFAELSEFPSIEAARDHVLEREIESLLRKSHVEQFDWLENKFSIKLRVDLPTWPIFVELTERRNLCVHADGVASGQYLNVCKDEGVDLGKVKKGDQLEVTGDYFKEAHKAVYEIGVKLGQVLWRKVVPEQIEEADDALHNLTYVLLRDSRYRIARVLLEFADTTLRNRHADERYRRLFVVNRALVHYLTGEKDKCKEILAGEDWSASSDMFQLAEAVLEERFEDAASLMRRIGNTKYPHKADYLHWPLFTRFRETTQFSAVFKEVFGEEEHDEALPTTGPEDLKPN